MKIRSIPYINPNNDFIDLYLSELRSQDIETVNFKWWKINSLKQRNIFFHLHWPEAVYRDDYFLLSLFKAIRFVLFFYLHKFNKNKWIFFLHNVIPHEDTGYFKNKINLFIFRILLKGSDRVIGLSKNTISEAQNRYKISIENKYTFIEHFLYPINKIASNSELSLYLNQNINFDYILTFHSDKRKKGTEILIQEFPKENDCKLIIIGSEIKLHNNNIIQIKNFPKTEIFNSLVKNSIGVILNYDRITTSGMFFHCLSLNKVSVVPNLNFFFQTSSKNTSIFYDAPLTEKKIIKIIKDLKQYKFKIDRPFNSVSDFIKKIK